MFEAHFQSFEDRTDRGASAARVAALRAELFAARARRLHRAARRPLSERIRAALRRAARLAHRLHRLGRHRHRACRPRGPLRRRPLSGAGARRSRRRDVHRSSISSRIRRTTWIEANLRGRRAGSAIRPWLHTIDGAERLAKACARSRRDACCRRRQSDRCDLDRPAARRRSAPVVAARSALRRRRGAPDKLARVRAEIEKAGADALVVSRSARGRPGCSTSAAATFRIRRVVLAFATVPQDGRPTLLCRLAASSATKSARASKSSPTFGASAAFERDLAALGGEQRAVRLDPATCPEAIARLVAETGGTVVRGADPIAPMKAVKNAAEIAGRACGATARRRGGDALPRLVRPRGAARPPHRDRRGRGAGELSPRHRAAQGHFVSRPSPAPEPNGAIVHYRVTRARPTAHRAGRTLSGRFRRAI